MAKLYFRYGAMGSSKTANAIMVQYNYQERNQRVLMVKPALENRDGERTLKSRCGLSAECVFMEELDDALVQQHDCVIVDEAQFLTKAQVEYLVHVVDELNIPVIAYGLRADFRGEFFEGSQWLMCWADTIEEVKTICWCGKKAIWQRPRLQWQGSQGGRPDSAGRQQPVRQPMPQALDDRRIRRLQRPESVKRHKRVRSLSSAKAPHSC